MISLKMAVKCVRIKIEDDQFKDIISKVGLHVVEHPL